MKNEKGSVLSVSIIVIVILSLALSMTTANTFDVAQRTSVIVESNDEELFAKAMVRNVVHEIKEIINDVSKTTGNLYQLSNAEVDSIIAENEAIIQNYYMAKLNVTLEELNVTYPNGFIQIDLDEIWTSDTGSSLKYTVSYTRLNASIISRSLLLELNATTGSSGTVVINTYEDIFDYFDKAFFEDNVFVCETGETNCTSDFKDDQLIDSGGGKAAFSDNVYVDQSMGITTWMPGQGNNEELDLNGKIFVVNGDLTISDFNEIYSSTDPGLIIVHGDLNINTTRHGVELDNVIILVRGSVNFSLYSQGNNNQRGRLVTINAHVVSLLGTNTIGLDKVAPIENGSSYTLTSVNETFNNQTLSYTYLGSDPNFSGLGFVIDEFSEMFDLGSFEFDFIESPFIFN